MQSNERFGENCQDGPGQRWAHFRRMGKQMLEMLGPDAEGRHPHHHFGRGGSRGGFGHGWGQGFPFPPGGGHGGPPFWGPFGRGGMRGARVKRGDVRSSILTLLAEQPRNGYQLIQEIGERSGGRWRPSPGSVYPALQQLEDEGLIRSEEFEGKKQFALTEAGQAALDEQSEDSVPPWESISEDVSEELLELQQLAGQVMGAVMMIGGSGSEKQQQKARKLLKQLRRSLYQILGDEDEETEE